MSVDLLLKRTMGIIAVPWPNQARSWSLINIHSFVSFPATFLTAFILVILLYIPSPFVWPNTEIAALSGWSATRGHVKSSQTTNGYFLYQLNGLIHRCCQCQLFCMPDLGALFQGKVSTKACSNPDWKLPESNHSCSCCSDVNNDHWYITDKEKELTLQTKPQISEWLAT